MVERDVAAVTATAACSTIVANEELHASGAAPVWLVRCLRNGAETRLRPCRHVAGTALSAPSAQRRSVRVRYTGGLVLVDLPVDVVVILEQQE
jgi:hypothetical protein